MNETWIIMGIIIVINIIVLWQVLKIGTQHDHHHEIQDAKDSKAVQRLNENYQLRLKRASENAPQTLLSSTPEQVDQTLAEAFTPENQPAKKPPVRRRSGGGKAEA